MAPAEPHTAAECAHRIAEAFANYNAEFRAITRRAPARFDDCDWKGSQKDAVERIELYDRYVNQTVAEMRLHLGERALDRELWVQIRDDFAEQIEGLPDNEFTKTFFSSITRRSFGTVGVAEDIEFVADGARSAGEHHEPRRHQHLHQPRLAAAAAGGPAGRSAASARRGRTSTRASST